MSDERISRTYPDLAGKKVCKTCDWCVKPNMWDHRNWMCKAPGNLVIDASIGKFVDMVSGDWVYQFDYCRDAMNNQGLDCLMYQIDPYIPINGVRHVDKLRATAPTTERITNSSLKKLTLDDIL